MFATRALVFSAAGLMLAAAAGAAERVSDFKPFAAGDIIVAATVMDDPNDDHRGTGRLLQFDKDLQPKGTLWIKETTHKIGGLAFGPDGVLWGFSPISWQVVEVSPAGKLLPLRSFGNRTFHSVVFAPDGTLFFGEHLTGTQRKIKFNTTEFRYMPGTERIGDGHIFHYTADGRFLEEYDNQVHGGLAGIHGTSCIVLEDDGTRMIYISETGDRLMQYDLAGRRQLPDLAKIPGQDGRPGMAVFMTRMPDRTLVLATGSSLLLVDPDSGATTGTVPLGSGGWAAVNPSIDAGHVLVGNFFTGEFIKLRLADGEVVARNSINEARSLSGIVQYSGRKVLARGPGFGEGNPYEAVIDASETAFMQRNLEGAIASLDPDYVLYDIREEGAVPRMQGRENVRRILGGFFAASDAWVDSEVDKWGLLKNLLVQVEYDSYRNEDGSVRQVPTLVVFEHRNGKRWREWRFRPRDETWPESP